MQIFINWFHFIGPKGFGLLSFVINPIFILLAFAKSRSEMGKYRYLLISFAIFDIAYSVADLLTPIGFINTPAGFATFLVDGPFSDNVQLAELAVTSHCFFISLSYAILTIHFFYRYILLCRPRIVNSFFKPVGVSLSLTYFFLQGFSWGAVCETCLAPDEEAHRVFGPIFEEAYSVDSRELGMITALFRNASDNSVRKSWAAMLTLNFLSTICLINYVFLGYKIHTTISCSFNLSNHIVLMHHRLFKALLVQTCIPTFCCFFPSIIVWYAPIFGLNLGWWSNYVCPLALAAFPFIDPLAIVFYIPSYKTAIRDFFIRRQNQAVTPVATLSKNNQFL